MKLASLEKTSCIAWSPCQQQSTVLALGTLAGAMDANFSTQTELELYEWDGINMDLKKLGAISTNSRYFYRVYFLTHPNRFHNLAWTPLKGSKRNGLLAGGKENGELDIYDPTLIIQGKNQPLVRHSIFSGSVKGLDFSLVNPGLLAAGGSDAEVPFYFMKEF